METSLLISITASVFLTFLATSYFVGSAKKKSYAQKFESWQARTKLAETKVNVLQSQLERVREEKASIQTQLAVQKESNRGVVAELESGFHVRMLKIGSLVLALGFGLGGASSWFAASSLSEIKHLEQTMEFQVHSRVAATQADLLQQELKTLKAEYSELRQEYQNEREAKAVILAKFEMLLQSLEGNRKTKNVLLDFRQMLDSWELQQTDFSVSSLPVAVG